MKWIRYHIHYLFIVEQVLQCQPTQIFFSKIFLSGVGCKICICCLLFTSHYAIGTLKYLYTFVDVKKLAHGSIEFLYYLTNFPIHQYCHVLHFVPCFKVFSQDVGKKRPVELKFRAKFYPEDISELTDLASQVWYASQTTSFPFSTLRWSKFISLNGDHNYIVA